MKGLLRFIITFSIVLSGCEQVRSPEENSTKQIADSTEEKPFANPILIQGSSFGHYFQTLYRQNRFEDMVKLTSDGIKENISGQELKKKYKELNFGFELGKLGSVALTEDTFTLIYPYSTRFGTRMKTQVNCIIEKDTVRFINLITEEIAFIK